MATAPAIARARQETVAEAFARDVLAGLSRHPKTLPSTWFYDARGSDLFRRITELEEYYPTRCEREILERHGPRLAALLAEGPFRLVELGSGDGYKTEILLRLFLQRGLDFEYVPVDICRAALVGLTESLRRRLPAVSPRVRPVVADYGQAMRLLRRQPAERNVVLFLGSSIGNFNHPAARRFLRGLRRALHPGDLVLIGFDLKKDVDVLVRAYNDSQGVTREFNFNLLDRINRELGGEFDRGRFLHYGPYNPHKGRMESWLVSREEQHVRIAALGRTLSFGAWEGIHVESSYKYDVAQIERFAARTGFMVEQHFFDVRRFFCDSLFSPLPLECGD